VPRRVWPIEFPLFRRILASKVRELRNAKDCNDEIVETPKEVCVAYENGDGVEHCPLQSRRRSDRLQSRKRTKEDKQDISAERPTTASTEFSAESPITPQPHLLGEKEQSTGELDVDTCKAVGFTDVRCVLDAQLRGEKQRKYDVLKGLPQHQQLLLCATCLADGGGHQEVCVRVDDAPGQKPLDSLRIYARYVELCQDRKISPFFSAMTVRGGLEGLQNSGLIAVEVKKSRATGTMSFRSPKKRQARNPPGFQTGSCAVMVDILHSSEEILAALKNVNGFFGGVMLVEGVAGHS